MPSEVVPHFPEQPDFAQGKGGGPCLSRVERDAPCYRERPPPHRTVRAVFPHTALRVGLFSSVSLHFAPRLRFTLIPMDAPPYGRAVSDAPPHSGLSPIAVFRHYYSRHLICIVPFTRRGPSHPRALPRFPATTASSDYCSRLRYWQFSQVPLQDFQSTPPPLPRRVPMAQIELAMRC